MPCWGDSSVGRVLALHAQDSGFYPQHHTYTRGIISHLEMTEGSQEEACKCDTDSTPFHLGDLNIRFWYL